MIRLSALVALLLTSGCATALTRQSEAKTEQMKAAKNPREPRLDSERRLIGSANSEITIVEYADFECSACRSAFDGLNRFKIKHQGKIQFYFKHMPLNFHKMAYPAAQYFEAIRMQDKAKAMKFFEYVFQNQMSLAEEDFLKKAAEKLAVNMVKLLQDIKSEQVRRIIEDDIKEFREFDFNGVPVLLLNGTVLEGAHDFESLEKVMNSSIPSKYQ
ncbi:MAG: thioredoxin domain-containing protein [Bdellovibrionales bacterium]|nr:thioredoxin domain-containing protein [Bdellovibrionales bacterium]